MGVEEGHTTPCNESGATVFLEFSVFYIDRVGHVKGSKLSHTAAIKFLVVNIPGGPGNDDIALLVLDHKCHVSDFGVDHVEVVDGVGRVHRQVVDLDEIWRHNC